MTTAAGAADRALIDALARRARAYGGATRRVLDARLAQLSAAWAAAPTPAVPEATAVKPHQPAPSPLATLLGHIAQQSAGPSSVSEVRPSPGPAELKSIQQFRSTWTRLRVDQRLQQARAQVPGNAGPLNTQRLLHQTLTAMGEVSPEYLHRLMAQVEALLWMEGAALPALHGKVPDEASRRTKQPARKA